MPVGVVPPLREEPSGPVHITSTVTSVGTARAKVMEQMRSMEPPFLDDDTITEVGASTVGYKMEPLNTYTYIVHDERNHANNAHRKDKFMFTYIQCSC